MIEDDGYMAGEPFGRYMQQSFALDWEYDGRNKVIVG